MIVAEVKPNDGDEFETRLFNVSMTQFMKLASRRFVEIGRVAEVPSYLILNAIRKIIGWDKD